MIKATATTAASTQSIRLLSMARARYEPTPGRRTLMSPTEIASEATTKNQPPDIDIIMFQMRPGMAKGVSNCQNFCQGVS